MDEGSSFRDQCLRDKRDTSFHGKQPPHSAASIRHGFFLISNILMSVLGDGEGQVDAGTENHTSVKPLMWEMDLQSGSTTFHPTKPALGLSWCTAMSKAWFLTSQSSQSVGEIQPRPCEGLKP